MMKVIKFIILTILILIGLNALFGKDKIVEKEKE